MKETRGKIRVSIDGKRKPQNIRRWATKKKRATAKRLSKGRTEEGLKLRCFAYFRIRVKNQRGERSLGNE